MRRLRRREDRRKADGDELEQEGVREAVAASSGDKAIEAVFGGGGGQEEQAWDDVSGGELDREEVRKARMEEVQHMKDEDLRIEMVEAW